ncbi:MAG: DUF1499 domain-containing protein [Rubellimicrobium sp.]|nr:DUF1499 domain-containing protein [Rubellimicrobium sp.]
MRLAVILLLVLLIVGGLLWIRLAPSDPERWHIDPLAAPLPVGNGWLVRPGADNAEPPQIALPPEATLVALDRIALATPRTTRLAGSPAEGRITYVTRSRLMGYPDYTTIAALPDGEGGSFPVLYARQRFGSRDQDVNRARIEDWLTRLAAGE